jgi:hypothetical protein
MTEHSHPPRDSSAWDNPDFRPFCGTELTDPGEGFLDHLETSSTCQERFEAWREAIASDIGSEWSG